MHAPEYIAVFFFPEGPIFFPKLSVRKCECVYPCRYRSGLLLLPPLGGTALREDGGDRVAPLSLACVLSVLTGSGTLGWPLPHVCDLSVSLRQLPAHFVSEDKPVSLISVLLKTKGRVSASAFKTLLSVTGFGRLACAVTW